MKRNILGLAAVVLAVGFSAFTNVNLKATKTFYHLKDQNKFVDVEPTDMTCQEDDVTCRLVFNGINLPSGEFNENSIPSSPTEYTVTREEEGSGYAE